MALSWAKKRNYLAWQKQLQSRTGFRYFWQFWSNYSFGFFVAAFVLLFFCPSLQDAAWPTVVLSAISFVTARWIIVPIINWRYKQERPYQEYKFEPITSKFFSLKTAIPNSFPSRHTTAFMSVAIVFACIVPGLGVMLVVVSAVTGAARVVLGFHWPSDILVGAIIGTVIGVLAVSLGFPAFFT